MSGAGPGLGREGGRAATRLRDPGFWTERKVRWYERALARSDYASAVLGVLDPVLAGCRSVLDVGAGCGALAIPLARRLERVTALEPAPAMADALRRAAAAGGLDHLEVVEAAWGEVALDRHDLVLCAHVGELTRGDAAFLREAPALAGRAVALVRDVGQEADKFFFRELYPRLLGRPYGAGRDHGETLEALARLGIVPAVHPIAYRSDQPFEDLEEACDFWEEYLGVAGPDVRAFLRQFLGPRLAPDAEGWIAPYPKQAVVISWTPAGA